ncbi:hypothetical protein H0H93_008796 [Arthromyces matolae]|nr:hypothetical protein H0H93_008796 [Arthromyces matolae]
MGGAQSLFYPDNPNRRLRAQQLADDCQAFQLEYCALKKEIEDELGPYKDKMDHVLGTFGCKTMVDLDNLVKSTATSEGLVQWQRIKASVDGLSDASDVFTTAMAVVAISGIAISAIGALAGGFGFFAGVAVTSSIISLLAVIGLVFDAVTGAIQRSQLRDAIDSLFKLRIQIKYLAEQISHLHHDIGGIRKIYAIFENAGYNKDKIVEEIRNLGTLEFLQSEVQKVTHLRVARELLEADETRVGGSWRDEDPDLEEYAQALDEELETKRHTDGWVKAETVRQKRQIETETPAYTTLAGPRLLQIGPTGLQYVVPQVSVDLSLGGLRAEGYARTILSANDDPLPTFLQEPIIVTLKEFISEDAATVYLRTTGGQILGTDPNRISMIPNMFSFWVISFANVAYAQQFLSHAYLDPSNSFLDVRLKVYGSQMYLRATGELDTVGDVLALRYA